MFWAIFLLLFLGILLIFLEVLVPHGLSVITGLCVIAFSCYLCYRSFGQALGVIYMIFASLMAGGAAFVAFRSGIRWLSLKPPAPAAAGHGAAGGDPLRPPLGESLRVTQPLRPTGTVEWQGRRYPARSLRPEADLRTGAQVRLREFDSIYLLVEPEE